MQGVEVGSGCRVKKVGGGREGLWLCCHSRQPPHFITRRTYTNTIFHTHTTNTTTAKASMRVTGYYSSSSSSSGGRTQFAFGHR